MTHEDGWIKTLNDSPLEVHFLQCFFLQLKTYGETHLTWYNINQLKIKVIL